MPRSYRSTGAPYRSVTPAAHPEARTSTRRRDTTPPAITPPEVSEDVTPEMALAQRVALPNPHIKWMKRVIQVAPNASCISDFVGHYVHDTPVWAMPGEIYIACIPTRNGVERVFLYVMLFDNQWYEVAEAPWPVVRGSGWHRMVRAALTSWTTHSRAQRIVRACTDGLLTAHQAMHSLEEEARQSGSALPDIVEYTNLQNLVDRLEDMISRVAGEATAGDPGTIRTAFDTWVTTTASAVALPEDDIRNIVQQSLPVGENSPIGALLRDLGDWFPEGTAFDVSCTSDKDLKLVQELIDKMGLALADERKTRDWQFQIMRTLGIGKRRSQVLALDRHLTQFLRPGQTRAAADYLIDTYGRSEVTETKLIDAITKVNSKLVSPEVRVERANDNRNLRKIRLGRKPDELREDVDEQDR